MTTLASTKLFGRSATLIVGSTTDPTVHVQAQFNEENTQGLDISGLDIEFVVEKSLRAAEPNTCQIKVFNMAPDHRQQLSGNAPLTVNLEAGYITNTSQLYFAGARAAWSSREGTDIITHIESTDTIARPTGLHKTKKIPPGSTTGSIYRTTGARIPIAMAFQQIAESLGVGLGNLNQALAEGSFPISSVNASALVGNGARRMTDLCRSAGLEWSIQDGVLQILNIAEALSTVNAIELSEDTGLIESPSVDSQGALSCTALLIPGLAPGVLIDMDSEFVQGGYRIEKIRYVGSTRGQEWYAHIEAVRYA